MLRRITLLSAVLPFLTLALACRSYSQDAPDRVEAIERDVVYLASDELEGRATGSNGEHLAAAYIATRFNELGLQPAGADGWYQDFDFVAYLNPHDSSATLERTGRNVLGYLDAGAEWTAVVGAHYDHLGYGGWASRERGESQIHNGADDNASGVAGIIEMARLLTEQRVEETNVLFVAFSGEELGLMGSKHFVANPTIDFETIKYMINLDMVGRLRESLVVAGVGTSPEWAITTTVADEVGLAIKVDSSGLGPSDHASFYLQDVPVMHLFTGQHAEYHKPDDDSPLINFDGIAEVADFAARVIRELDDSGPIAFTPTRDRNQGRAASFKVSLGVMPDYAYSGVGLRIDAVLDDRPGSRAGLEAGDVIVRLGEKPVNDIYGYMRALGPFDKGDRTEVVVRRGEAELEFPIEF